MPHQPARSMSRSDRAPVVVFSLTLFVSAFLLFSIQPMFAKMVLPFLGGTPAVWNTCLVFFQAALLGGYAYAHFSTARLGVRRQARWHLGLLLLPLLVLPIRIPHHWVPPTEANPIPWLLGLMGVAVGLPFFVVSTSAPLLQTWFAQTRHPSADDPYFLYAASNGGSLLALLSYPILIEPRFRLVTQGWMWAIGYTALILLITACGVIVWRSQAGSTEDAHGSAVHSSAAHQGKHITLNQRAWWVMLSLVPSSLLLGVTRYLSTDVAAIPLLWVIPLAVYLLTFILVFAKRPPIPHALMVRAMPLVILPLAILMVSNTTRSVWLLIPLHLLMFFVVAMVCHGELANDRPSASHLTDFYLCLSIGGVLGGLFNALLAPLLFTTVLEYPLAMVLACLLRPATPPQTMRPRTNWLDWAMPVALGALVVGLALVIKVSDIDSRVMRLGLLCAPPALICYAFRYRPIRFGLAIGVFLFVGMFFAQGWENILYSERSFFGVYRIMRNGPYHELTNGTTLHGAQSLDPARRREPLTYYHPTGPLGDIFAAFAGETPTLKSVAVIGLGTASTACYASPGQAWTFYEIDPTVKRIATDPNFFTFVRDCLEQFHVVLGDARLSLARAPNKAYDLITVDAFSSDAIPVHLITQEALLLYLSKLADGGLVAFHTSNRYLRLPVVLANLAARNGLICIGRHDDQVSPAQFEHGKTTSEWVVIARRMEDVKRLSRYSTWQRLPGQRDTPIWTDDFSNLLGVFRWN